MFYENHGGEALPKDLGQTTVAAVKHNAVAGAAQQTAVHSEARHRARACDWLPFTKGSRSPPPFHAPQRRSLLYATATMGNR